MVSDLSDHTNPFYDEDNDGDSVEVAVNHWLNANGCTDKTWTMQAGTPAARRVDLVQAQEPRAAAIVARVAAGVRRRHRGLRRPAGRLVQQSPLPPPDGDDAERISQRQPRRLGAAARFGHIGDAPRRMSEALAQKFEKHGNPRQPVASSRIDGGERKRLDVMDRGE